MAAFGLSFGKKKTAQNSTTDVNKTESTSQNTAGTRATTGTTSTNQNTSTTGQSTGQSLSTTTGVQSTQGQTNQTTTSFGAQTLGALEQVVNQLFGSTQQKANVGGNFDPAQFVADQVAAATSDINAGLEDNVNQLATKVGGAGDANSMTALLASRLNNDAAAERAGVRAQATQTAQGITRDNALAGNQIDATGQAFLGNLLNALKGGQQTTTGTETQVQNTAQQQATQQSEQQSQQQQSSQVQTQNLLEALTQLLTGNTTTVGTEAVDATTKQKGGGFSLGI